MSELTIIHHSPLLDGVTDKDGRSRLGRFEAWLQTNGLAWHNPDMQAYRDDLLQTLAPATVAAHLSSIRGRYMALLADNRVRDGLYALTPSDAAPGDKKPWSMNCCSGWRMPCSRALPQSNKSRSRIGPMPSTCG